MKNVASVTMKLGSRVLTTVIPLMNPIARPNASTIAIAGQMFMSWCVVEVGEQQPRAADHHARGEVELAADHQQGNRHGHDPVLRRLVGPAGVDRAAR